MPGRYYARKTRSVMKWTMASVGFMCDDDGESGIQRFGVKQNRTAISWQYQGSAAPEGSSQATKVGLL